MIRSFGKNYQTLVVGSSGGIGEAFVKEFLDDVNVTSVISLSRAGISIENEKLKNFYIDIEDEESIKKCANQLTRHVKNLRIIIIATGVLHSENFMPEKSIKSFNSEIASKNIKINTIGPALVIKYLYGLLDKQQKTVIAALSARVGSIDDNRLGGWYSYRLSKAALNMFIKTTSIELSRIYPKTICLALHPGTVDTKLSKPFKKNIPKDKNFLPKFSVKKMLNVIDEISIDDSGSFISWDGKEIKF